MRACAAAGVPEEEVWEDVDDAGKSMAGSCESAEAGCCGREARTNTEAGGLLHPGYPQPEWVS